MLSNLDKTIVQSMRAQSFEVQDELGTVVTMPIDTNLRIPRPVAVAPAPEVVFADEDPLARMEQKLDAALRQIEKLQQRIESLDLTLARALSR